jgi:hypothetical protein
VSRSQPASGIDCAENAGACAVSVTQGHYSLC